MQRNLLSLSVCLSWFICQMGIMGVLQRGVVRMTWDATGKMLRTVAAIWRTLSKRLAVVISLLVGRESTYKWYLYHNLPSLLESLIHFGIPPHGVQNAAACAFQVLACGAACSNPSCLALSDSLLLNFPFISLWLDWNSFNGFLLPKLYISNIFVCLHSGHISYTWVFQTQAPL